jgi:hypothetical protein
MNITSRNLNKSKVLNVMDSHLNGLERLLESLSGRI